MAITAINTGSFCTGVGWLDVAVGLACEYHEIGTRPVFVAEWDAYAASVLKSRMEESALEPCPIFVGDIREFPAGEFRGVVDAVVAGFPCQDISFAGRGDGIYGERSGLWFDILDAAVRMGARYLFLENVAAITVRGLDAVLGSLAESGFDAEWTCLKASDVGASHRRERWFCVAYRRHRREQERARTTGNGREGPEHTGPGGNLKTLANTPNPKGRRDESERGSNRGTVAGRAGEELGDAIGVHGQRGATSGQQAETRSAVRCGELGDTECDGQRDSRGAEAEVAVEGCQGIFAPGPSDGRWPKIIRESPYLAPAVEPNVCRVPYGANIWVDNSRADKLRCVGNSVVPLQAAVAFAKLLGRVAEFTPLRKPA